MRTLVLLLLLTALLAGCQSEPGASDRGNAGEHASGEGAAREKTVEKKYTPPKNPLSAPEPAVSPPLREKPAGKLIEVRSGPEGVVADPETGRVFVAGRTRNVLQLLDPQEGGFHPRFGLS